MSDDIITLSTRPMDKTMQCLGQMRWLSKATASHPPRLQQAWRDVDSGKVEWYDVPTVLTEPK